MNDEHGHWLCNLNSKHEETLFHRKTLHWTSLVYWRTLGVFWYGEKEHCEKSKETKPFHSYK